MNNSCKEIQRVLRPRRQAGVYYDRISRFYDFLAERNEGPVRTAGLKKLSPRPGEQMLEIGFGTGHSLASLAEAAMGSGRVYGVDLSEGMLKRARANLNKEGVYGCVELICGDGARLPLRAASLDAAFMSFTLELFDTPDIPVVLGECRRVLRPGGRIVLVSLSKEGQATLLLRAFEWTHQHFSSLLDCRPIFARRALEAAGFRIVNAEMRKMWIPVEIVLATVN